MTNSREITAALLAEAKHNRSARIYQAEALDFDRIQQAEYSEDEFFSFERFSGHIYEIACNQQLVPYKSLHSHRNKFLATIIIFCKKIIRRCIKFYVEPVAEDQSRVNAMVVKSLEDVSRYINGQSGCAVEVEELKRDVRKNFKNTLDECCRQNEDVQRRNGEMEEKLKHLEQEVREGREDVQKLRLKAELLELENKKLTAMLENSGRQPPEVG